MTPIEKAKEALSDCVEMYVLADGIQQFEDFENGQPSLGTCKNLKMIKEAAMQAREALAALEAEKPAEDVEDVNSASWAFMSITEMDEGFTKRRERMKILIGRRDERIRESYHANKCAKCKSNEAQR